MNTARIIAVNIDEDDGVYLITAKTSCCRKTVTHGAGRDPDNLALGHRTAHCRCGVDGYELIDETGIIPLRLRVILAEAAERQALRDERRALRVARSALAEEVLLTVPSNRRPDIRARRLRTLRSAR